MRIANGTQLFLFNSTVRVLYIFYKGDRKLCGSCVIQDLLDVFFVQMKKTCRIFSAVDMCGPSVVLSLHHTKQSTDRRGEESDEEREDEGQGPVILECVLCVCVSEWWNKCKCNMSVKSFLDVLCALEAFTTGCVCICAAVWAHEHTDARLRGWMGPASDKRDSACPGFKIWWWTPERRKLITDAKVQRLGLRLIIRATTDTKEMTNWPPHIHREPLEMDWTP